MLKLTLNVYHMVRGENSTLVILHKKFRTLTLVQMFMDRFVSNFA